MILAMIQVIQCEDCDTVAVLKDFAEHEAYEAAWFDGLKYHFCPKCRHKPQAEDRIAEEQELLETMRGKKEVTQYVH